MSGRFFPRITASEVTALKAAAVFAAQDPSYLDDVNCKYPREIRDVVRILAGSIDGVQNVAQLEQKVEKVTQETINFATDPTVMEKEISTIYAQVKGMITKLSGTGAGGHDDDGGSDKDAVAMLTNAVKLLEKLTGLAEVNLGHKRSADFKAVVMEVLEEVLLPEQRTAYVTKLRDHL